MPQAPVDLDAWQQARLNAISNFVHLSYTCVVEGDVAEFGIGRGSSLSIIAETMQQCEQRYSNSLGMRRKKLHGFDSFSGMPLAKLQGDIDAPMVSKGIWGEGKCNSPGVAAIEDIVNQHLPLEDLKLYPGYFQETLPMLDKATVFSFVNVDCDLYESSIQVLDHLFSHRRLTDGCYLLFDDFVENRFSKALGQRKAWEEAKARYNVEHSDMGRYGLAGWAFVVHGYTS